MRDLRLSRKTRGLPLKGVRHAGDYRVGLNTPTIVTRSQNREPLLAIPSLHASGVRVISATTIMLQNRDPYRSKASIQLHTKNVLNEANKIKKHNELIKMTQGAKRFIEKNKAGWQSVIWSGITAAPDKKTFIRTYDDGTLEIFIEGIV